MLLEPNEAEGCDTHHLQDLVIGRAPLQQHPDLHAPNSEWTYGSLLFVGFWNKKLGALGALGSTATFFATFTIMPFVPGAWDAAAGGFPAMTIVSGFLLKDLVLLVVSVYLLKQDLARVIEARMTRSVC